MTAGMVHVTNLTPGSFDFMYVRYIEDGARTLLRRRLPPAARGGGRTMVGRTS